MMATDTTDQGGPVRSAGLADDAAAAFAAYRAGDEQRMSDLVELVTPLLWHLARGAGASHQGAQDAVQATWLKLVAKADTVQDPQAVLAWLMTTLRRTVISAARARRDVVIDVTQRTHDRPDDEPGPAQQAVLNDRQQVLWDHVGMLGERCQHLLRVVAFAHRPDYSTIAAELGMPVGSIGPTRGRCLTKLRRSLEEDPRWEGSIHA